MDKKIKEMRSEAMNKTSDIIIGKNGLTDQVIANINELLSRQKLVKLKILQSYISDKDKNVVFDDIATKTHSKVVQKIGFTITLTRR
jgi:putative YhbY family RNA-binding protein